MAKIIEISTGFLGEEMTLKTALQEFAKERQDAFNKLNKDKTKFFPNQHIYKAHIKNCRAMLKKL